MGLRYDASKVMGGNYPIITQEGWYPFRIVMATEGKSKTGNYMVTVDSVCLDARWKDYNVRHWVVFMPPEQKGASMAIHFLKSIGEPFEGQIDVEPINWERKTFMGKVAVNEYDGKKNNKFAEIGAIDKEVREGGKSIDEQDPFGD